MTHEEVIKKHYRALNHEHQTEIRVFGGKYQDGKCIYVDNEQDFVKEVSRLNKQEKQNVYVGLNERKLNTNGNDNVISCRFIPVDLDFHSGEIDLNEVQRTEKSFTDANLKYEFKIFTGGGFQYYFPIPELTENNSIKETLDKAKAFLKKNCDKIDGSVYNSERVLRVWGTYNWKRDKQGELVEEHNLISQDKEKNFEVLDSNAVEVDVIETLIEKQDVPKFCSLIENHLCKHKFNSVKGKNRHTSFDPNVYQYCKTNNKPGVFKQYKSIQERNNSAFNNSDKWTYSCASMISYCITNKEVPIIGAALEDCKKCIKYKQYKENVDLDDREITYEFMPTILKNPIPKPKWRVEGLVPETGITYVAAAPGEGKTMLCAYMSLCISSGKPFLGKTVMPGKVMYFDAENGEICLYDRFKRITEGHFFEDEELKNLAISTFPYIRFDIEHSSYETFSKFFNEFKPDVIVFDSLVRFMEGSENDAESCKAVFDFLRKWLKQNPNLTIIILHHLSKQNSGGMNALRGSSEIVASAASILMLRRLSSAYKLSVEKSRYIDMSQNHDLYYQLQDTEAGLEFSTCEAQDLPVDAVGRAEQDFWEWVNESNVETFQSGVCQTKLQSKGHSKDGVYKLLGNLLKDGSIAKLKRGKYEIKDKVFTSEEEVK